MRESQVIINSSMENIRYQPTLYLIVQKKTLTSVQFVPMNGLSSFSLP